MLPEYEWMGNEKSVFDLGDKLPTSNDNPRLNSLKSLLIQLEKIDWGNKHPPIKIKYNQSNWLNSKLAVLSINSKTRLKHLA